MLKKSVAVGALGIAVVGLAVAFVKLDTLWHKKLGQITIEISTEPPCIPGYVLAVFGNCVPGYDPAKGPRPVRRSVYDEYATYGSAPFRRGDVR